MKFGKTMSVKAFKAMLNAESLQVIKNPTVGKNDFVVADGVTVGSVSKNYDPTKDKEFVELTELDSTGATMWCLHNPSTLNVLEVL